MSISWFYERKRKVQQTNYKIFSNYKKHIKLCYFFCKTDVLISEKKFFPSIQFHDKSKVKKKIM